MQWFEAAPGNVRATVDAYLAATAAHERAAEAARRAAVAAQALAARMPPVADVHPGDRAGTGRGEDPGVDPGAAEPGGEPGVDPARPDPAGPGAAGPRTPVAEAAGLGVAGGAPWPGELLEVLVRRLPAGDLPLASLNQAELAVATGARPGEQRLVPLPHLDALPAWARQVAVVEGRHSLARRGLVAADGQPGWALAALLALRTRPRAVTVAGPERQLPAPCHYLYGVGGDAVLEEIAEPAGTHHFTLRSRGSACARLTRLADPCGRARESSPPLLVDDPTGVAAWAAVHTATARAEHITRLSTTRPGPAAAQWLLLRLIAGPDGLLAIACRHAGTSQGANARWLSGWALQRLLLACLDVAPGPSRPGR